MHMHVLFYVLATQTSISMDRTLLNELGEAMIKLDRSFQPETVEMCTQFHYTMLDAMNLYTALASYENRAVDASVGLRDM